MTDLQFRAAPKAKKVRGVKKAEKGHNRYCGPGALAALTGINTEQAARLLREVSGRRAIKGTNTSWLLSALNRLGFSAYNEPLQYEPGEKLGRMTLNQWAKRSREKRARDPFLVQLSSHWCVVQGRSYTDNVTGSPVPLREAPNKKARVERVYRVMKTSNIRPSEVVPAKRPRKADPNAHARYEAKKLAAQYGVNIEIERIEGTVRYYVWPPASIAETELDPLEHDHYRYEWAEVLDAVKQYQKVMDQL